MMQTTQIDFSRKRNITLLLLLRRQQQVNLNAITRKCIITRRTLDY